MQNVLLKSISPNPNNPRHIIDPAEVKELAASLKAVGLIQPIILRPKGQGFEVVCGHRRFAAAKLAGLDSIPSEVRDIADEDVLKVQTIENVQRADMHPLDEALAFKAMVDAGQTGAEVAATVGKSAPHISQRLSLLGLSPKCREAFKKGQFNVAVAYVLARIPNAKVQDEVYRDHAEGGFITNSAAEVADAVLRHHTMKLSEAPFQSEDVTLYPKAGACAACPRRSGAAGVLFADYGKADRCLEPSCWKAKMEAHTSRVLKEAEKAGATLLKGEALDRAQGWNAPFVSLNSPCDEHPQRAAWRAILKGKGVKLSVGVDSRGRLVELADRKEAYAALKAMLPAKTAKKGGKGSEALDRAEQERAERRAQIKAKEQDRATVYEASRRVYAAAVKRGGVDKALAGVMVEDVAGHMNSFFQRYFCVAHNIPAKMVKGFSGKMEPSFTDAFDEWVSKRTEAEKVGFIFAGLTIIYGEWGAKNERFKAVCAALKVDVAACAEAAKAAIKAKKEGREKKAVERKATAKKAA